MAKFEIITLEKELRRVTHEVEADTRDEAEHKVKTGNTDAVYIGSEHVDSLEWVSTVVIVEVAPDAR